MEDDDKDIALGNELKVIDDTQNNVAKDCAREMYQKLIINHDMTTKKV